MLVFQRANEKLIFAIVLLVKTVAVDSAGNCAKSGTFCVNADPDICTEETRCLGLYWTEQPPYAYLDKNGNVTGIIVDVFKKLLEHCCADCSEVVETSPRNLSEFQHPPELAQVIVPEKLSASQMSYYSGFIPIVKDPSSVLIKKDEGWVARSKRILNAVFGAWSVVCIALLMSLFSGIIIWLLETWFNVEQFPRNFLKGVWEGFWWAFVSMTTVGYGDRSPTSFLGRTFAVLWIVIGVVMCSIFTATLTSALTNSNTVTQTTINRVKIGAISNSLEVFVGLNNGAEITYYNSTDELWEALVKDNVEGILIDSYYSLTTEAEEMMTKNGLEVHSSFKSKDWSYGVLLLYENLTKCMNEMYSKHYMYIFSTAVANQPGISHKLHEKPAAGPMFDSNEQPFRLLLMAGGICCLVTFLIGISWDIYKRKSKQSTAPSSGNSELGKLQKIENEVIAEVQLVFSAWKSKFSEKNGNRRSGEKDDNV